MGAFSLHMNDAPETTGHMRNLACATLMGEAPEALSAFARMRVSLVMRCRRLICPGDEGAEQA
jgi:hypothetical protein